MLPINSGGLYPLEVYADTLCHVVQFLSRVRNHVKHYHATETCSHIVNVNHSPSFSVPSCDYKKLATLNKRLLVKMFANVLDVNIYIYKFVERLHLYHFDFDGQTHGELLPYVGNTQADFISACGFLCVLAVVVWIFRHHRFAFLTAERMSARV